MRHLVALASIIGSLLVCSGASANIYSCCEIAAADGACVSQSSSCALTAWGAELSVFWAAFRSDGWDLDGSYPFPFAPSCSDPNVMRAPGDYCEAGWEYGIPPAVYSTSFPAGTDGYLKWSSTASPAWLGLCLDAPSSTDPMHAGPTEPIGCMTFSLSPGVSAQMARYRFPVDSRWDAYQLCYGPHGDGGACGNLNDQNSQIVSPTPVSGSCCAPPQLLQPSDLVDSSDWQIIIGQEIPGVPVPSLIDAPDGGFDLNLMGGDTFGDVPDACLPSFNEPSNCGAPPTQSAPPPTQSSPAPSQSSPPAQGSPLPEASSSAIVDASISADGAGTPCVPTTCAAQHETCAVIPDGCGGTLNCLTSACSQGGGCSSVQGTETGKDWRFFAPLVLVGLVSARSSRRRSNTSRGKRRVFP
ncbi:MAG: hypothetical protein WBY94_20040 [Polyangiaceae bacterium]